MALTAIRHRLFGLLAFLPLLVSPFQGVSQASPKAKGAPDTLAIKIGAPLKYELAVKAPLTAHVIWPVLKDSIGAFEILEKQPIDTTVREGEQQYRQTFTLTNFKPGEQVLPAVSFPYQSANGSSDTLFTDSFRVQVSTVKVDSGRRIQPLKGLMEVPLTFREILPYILAGLAIIGLGVLGYWLFKRWQKRKHAPTSTAKPVQMPHEKALQELKALEDAQLWQKGHIKEYHDQLTDIIRAYLERILGIQAMELTTSEIMNELQGRALTPHQKDQLQELFSMADMAKFARAQPSADENQKALSVAYQFIRETKGSVTNQTEDNN